MQQKTRSILQHLLDTVGNSRNVSKHENTSQPVCRERQGGVQLRLTWRTHLIDIELSTELEAAAFSFLLVSPPERIFQKRSVSSAAAVAMVVPSGDWAMCSTREVWPVSSATCGIQ